MRQLARLSQDRWNDPAPLAEILDELRHRDEEEAEPLIRSIARRLSVLNYHPPERAEKSGEADTAGRADASARRRRRWIVAAVVALAAVGGGAYWLRHKPPAPPAEEAKGGLEVAGHGAPQARPGAAGRPAGFDFRLDLIDPEILSARLDALRSLRRSSAVGRPAEPVALSKPPPERPDPAELHLRAAELAPRPARSSALAEPEPRDAIEPLPVLPQQPVAENGIYIGQARLTCYRADDDPEGCGPDLWGPRTRPGPTRAPRNLEVAAALQESRDVARATGRQPVVPGSGELKPASSGRPIWPPPRELRRDAVRDQKLPPQCPPPPIGRAVFILDMSLSMGLPLGVDAATEDRLDEGVKQKDPEARRRYRELLAEPGPKRVTRARDAFESAAAKLPDWVELGLVVFRECKDIRKVGIYEAAQRGRAIDYIRKLIPRGRTPIADSLIEAATMLGDGPSSIILLTDGREFCGGDPCAAAARIASEHPQTPIQIIDISGQAQGECMAQATKGRVYTPDAAEDLGRVVFNAFRGADAACQVEANGNAAAR